MCSLNVFCLWNETNLFEVGKSVRCGSQKASTLGVQWGTEIVLNIPLPCNGLLPLVQDGICHLLQNLARSSKEINCFCAREVFPVKRFVSSFHSLLYPLYFVIASRLSSVHEFNLQYSQKPFSTSVLSSNTVFTHLGVPSPFGGLMVPYPTSVITEEPYSNCSTSSLGPYLSML